MRQRTQRRSSERRRRHHRCRLVMIVLGRWRSMTKPSSRWVMMATTKDDCRNCLGNGTWEMKLATMLSHGGSRETRAERRWEEEERPTKWETPIPPLPRRQKKGRRPRQDLGDGGEEREALLGETAVEDTLVAAKIEGGSCPQEEP